MSSIRQFHAVAHDPIDRSVGGAAAPQEATGDIGSHDALTPQNSSGEIGRLRLADHIDVPDFEKLPPAERVRLWLRLLHEDAG